MTTAKTVVALLFCFSASAQVPPSPTIRLMAAPVVVITNRPVVVEFDPVATNQQFFTSSSGTNTVTVTNFVKSSAGYLIHSNVTMTTKVWEEIPIPRLTNNLITCIVGTNRDFAATNFIGSVITNRGPVTFWLPPTNRYVFTLWGLAIDGQKWPIKQAEWPTAPSNQLRFISTPLFSKNLRDWTVGTNTYTFTVTNGIDYGTNLFVRWSTIAVKDDFTQKAVVFDSNTFGMFPTNAP